MDTQNVGVELSDGRLLTLQQSGGTRLNRVCVWLCLFFCSNET